MGKGSSKLTKEELKELEETSNFSAEELQGLYKGWNCFEKIGLECNLCR